MQIEKSFAQTKNPFLSYLSSYTKKMKGELKEEPKINYRDAVVSSIGGLIAIIISSAIALALGYLSNGTCSNWRKLRTCLRSSQRTFITAAPRAWRTLACDSFRTYYLEFISSKSYYYSDCACFCSYFNDSYQNRSPSCCS